MQKTMNAMWFEIWKASIKHQVNQYINYINGREDLTVQQKKEMISSYKRALEKWLIP